MDAKAAVRDFWEAESCGTRYGLGQEDRFQAITEARYRLEPYILPFADFPSASGKRVLEIGVGLGTDFSQWVRQADHATGVDLTDAAIRQTADRLQGLDPSRYALQQADAENLPFPDDSFDIVYSWGVLHHTPDTPRAFREAARVLKPGGVLKAMVYQPHCWTALMLWTLHGLMKGRPSMSLREAMFDHLESPGTKSYTPSEGVQLMEQAGLTAARAWPKLAGGDLLEIDPSARYQRFKLVWRLYPRPLVRLLGDRFGVHLLMQGTKPA